MRILRSENLGDRALHVGDVMLDAIRHNADLAGTRSTALAAYDLAPGTFGLVTLHRPANTEPESLRRLLRLLEEAAVENVPLIFPVHPRTRAVLDALGNRGQRALRLAGPLGYLDMISILQAAAVVITDSGGVQKEAAFLRTPCITLRDETEWTETVELGVNRLLGARAEGLNKAVFDACSGESPVSEDVLDSIDEFFGGGEAGRRIAEDCVSWLR
jgi:UDP-N-acetylglucosamine 2-epimerase